MSRLPHVETSVKSMKLMKVSLASIAVLLFACALGGRASSAQSDSSASADPGYAYGSYELRVRATDEKPAERGYYARVRKRARGGARRVVFNVANPAQ